MVSGDGVQSLPIIERFLVHENSDATVPPPLEPIRRPAARREELLASTNLFRARNEERKLVVLGLDLPSGISRPAIAKVFARECADHLGLHFSSSAIFVQHWKMAREGSRSKVGLWLSPGLASEVLSYKRGLPPGLTIDRWKCRGEIQEIYSKRLDQRLDAAPPSPPSPPVGSLPTPPSVPLVEQGTSDAAFTHPVMELISVGKTPKKRRGRPPKNPSSKQPAAKTCVMASAPMFGSVAGSPNDTVDFTPVGDAAEGVGGATEVKLSNRQRAQQAQLDKLRLREEERSAAEAASRAARATRRGSTRQ